MQTHVIMSRQFAEEIATRCWRRERTYLDQDCSFVELARFDAHLDALFDGLCAHAQQGQQAALAQIQRAGDTDDGAADGFCALALALLQEDNAYFSQVLDQLRGRAYMADALGQALQWVGNAYADRVATWCVEHAQPEFNAAGLRGLRIASTLAPGRLQALVHHADEAVSIEAMHLAADMRATELAPDIAALASKPSLSAPKQFAAHRAMVLLTAHARTDALWALAWTDRAWSDAAVQVLGACTAVHAGMPVKPPGAALDAEKIALRFTTFLGSIAPLEWAATLLQSPFQAQARQAIQAVTGFAFQPKHDGAEQRRRFEQWWSENRQRFDGRQRYLFGQAETAYVLGRALTDLPQSHRECAALRLQLMGHTRRLLPTRAAARRQWQQFVQRDVRGERA